MTHQTHPFHTRIDDEVAIIDASLGDAVPQDPSTIERIQLRRRRLIATRDRINTGRFGTCCECGVVLEPERLERDVTVVFCADCLAER
jgi:RNA polymerase-binding transcription factor DksA